MYDLNNKYCRRLVLLDNQLPYSEYESSQLYHYFVLTVNEIWVKFPFSLLPFFLTVTNLLYFPLPFLDVQYFFHSFFILDVSLFYFFTFFLFSCFFVSLYN